MNTRESEISNRLEAISDILKINISNIVSVKLNPLQPSEQETIFGKFSNAYQYSSEYSAGLDKINIQTPNNFTLKRIFPTVRHPICGDAKKVVYIIKYTNSKDIFWIQHETGLEIIGAVNDIIEIAKILIEIFNKIIKKMKSNSLDNNSDRYHKKISRIVTTTRKYYINGQISETIIEETEIINETFGLTPKEFEKKLLAE